jgi:hypothetical protein
MCSKLPNCVCDAEDPRPNEDAATKALRNARSVLFLLSKPSIRNGSPDAVIADCLANLDAALLGRSATPVDEPATPAAFWRVDGQPDPHAGRYDGERATLPLGDRTDDELANEVFLHDHRSLDVAAIMSGKPSSMSLLTAAKERIRWLSRKLIDATSETPTGDEPAQYEIDAVAAVFAAVEHDQTARSSAYIMAKKFKRVFCRIEPLTASDAEHEAWSYELDYPGRGWVKEFSDAKHGRPGDNSILRKDAIRNVKPLYAAPPSEIAREALTQCQKALSTLPIDALGYGEDDAGRWSLRDELLQSIDKALSTAPVSAWQDISTAPLDGKPFLARYQWLGEHRYMVIRRSLEGPWWIRDGSSQTVGGERDAIQFTDWQPLPAGPIAHKERSPTASRCPHCDDTGDVHRADGEWLGSCDCRSSRHDGGGPQS